MPGLELSLGQASGETVSLELSQTDEFSEMGEDIGEDHQEHASDESADFSEADETEDEAPFDVLRDGSTVQVTA